MSAFDIDPAAYTEGDPFQRERQTVFATNWLPFAASAQMPAAGDYVNHSLGGWPLFAVRGDDGVARAFHNQCRHQAMPVVEGPAGHCDVLRCRYHGWTYGWAGEFQEAPPRVAPTEPAAQLGLRPAALLEQNGFCLVRVRPGDEPPPSFPAATNPLAIAVATDIDANWKAVTETLLAAPDLRFVWPLAFVAERAAGSVVVRQLVPRSFLRTRLIDLTFSPGGAIADEAAALWRHRAAADKTAAEACQTQRAAAAPTATSPPFAAFIARLAAACDQA